MPVYEYECLKCGHIFEHFLFHREKEPSMCPTCGEKRLRRLVSKGVGFVFKGSGFYATDYKTEKSKTEEKKTDDKKTCCGGNCSC